MRTTLSRLLVEAAKNDERIVVLSGDHGYALFDDLRRTAPDQFINAGVAEQNMIGVAAGLAKSGHRPIIYGLSSFVPVRVLEQIKLDICYEGLAVTLLGDGAGVVYSTLGASHQSCEDIALMRVLPGMSVMSPADPYEVEWCFHAAMECDGPAYVRIGKADLGNVHRASLRLEVGQLCRFGMIGEGLAFIATGSMVHTAVQIAHNWANSEVWSVPCLKPIDRRSVAEICKRHSLVVTMEEHSVYGGLGSIVTEIASELAPTRVLRIGIPDRFSECCGSYNYLLREHRLDAPSIIDQVDTFLETGFAATSHVQTGHLLDIGRRAQFP